VNELGVPGADSPHYLVPVVLERFPRHERLAHPDIRVLEIDVVFIDPEHDDVVTAVPLIGD